MTTLQILHITRAEILPAWWNEFQIHNIAATVPCGAELITKAEQMADTDWLTEAEAQAADALDLFRTQEDARF